jgi:PhnB protein
MKAANPYLNFNGNTEEAFEHYRSIVGGELLAVVRFRDFEPAEGEATPEMGKEMQGMTVAAQDRDKIAHIALPLGDGNILMGTDALESMGKPLTVGNNFYIALEAESEEEADRLFDALADGGSVEMALQRTEWAEKYGSCVDKYGVQWMVSYTGEVVFPARAEG